MYEIVDLILEYKTTPNNQLLQKILDILNPYIRAKANKVHPFYREDILQELRLGTVLVIQRLNLLAISLDKELFQTKNYIYLSERNFSLDAIQRIFPNPYFLSFFKETGVEILKNAFITKNLYPIQQLYKKFTIRNQFYHILEKKYNSILYSFYRKYSSCISLETVSLNMKNPRGIERIEELPSAYTDLSINLEKYGIQKEDASFLMLFMDGSVILSQEKVSKLLGTSQQNISKKIVALRKKYQGKLLK